VARAVVITGASSGIGRAAALRLAPAGWRVFAGVRRQADAESLRREGVPLPPAWRRRA
jgi:NAD(P)-dependent dehydrogenase (short-subunit alcohol dehydrogenase family)